MFRFRRDRRLADHEGLTAAATAGPVTPVFLLDLAEGRRRAFEACGAARRPD
ncbi:deoxyribodipyrimidine photo-lyase [uncultured Amaricoccus sp.]|uniref:deoxyribodipyrimidine photo-lyase n=1 Tax=uncultured Amaricoccus sp. TaxID=339341 RepID=UPI0026344D88|nr:deoxyribodipyrimidine photo-lyase [uncultured Amaricoccus sp.]